MIMNMYKFDKEINETVKGFYNRCFDLKRQGKIHFSDDSDKAIYMIPTKKIINDVEYKGIVQVAGTIDDLELIDTYDNSINE